MRRWRQAESADELEMLGVTPTELSRQIAVPPNRISQLINGKPSRATRRCDLLIGSRRGRKLVVAQHSAIHQRQQ